MVSACFYHVKRDVTYVGLWVSSSCLRVIPSYITGSRGPVTRVSNCEPYMVKVFLVGTPSWFKGVEIGDLESCGGVWARYGELSNSQKSECGKGNHGGILEIWSSECLS